MIRKQESIPTGSVPSAFLVPGDMMSPPVWSQRGVWHYPSPPSPREQTNTCKNITFPQLRFAGGNKRNRPVHGHLHLPCHGLFTLPDTDSGSDSDLDSKSDGYIVICRIWSHCTDLYSDPYSLTRSPMVTACIFWMDIHTRSPCLAV